MPPTHVRTPDNTYRLSLDRGSSLGSRIHVHVPKPTRPLTMMSRVQRSSLVPPSYLGTVGKEQVRWKTRFLTDLLGLPRKEQCVGTMLLESCLLGSWWTGEPFAAGTKSGCLACAPAAGHRAYHCF